MTKKKTDEQVLKDNINAHCYQVVKRASSGRKYVQACAAVMISVLKLEDLVN